MGRIAPTERRMLLRYRSAKPSVCLPITIGYKSLHPIQIQDVSIRGMSLIVGQYFAPGRILAVAVPGMKPDSGRSVVFQVRRVQLCADGRWILGGALTSSLTKREFLDLL